MEKKMPFSLVHRDGDKDAHEYGRTCTHAQEHKETGCEDICSGNPVTDKND